MRLHRDHLFDAVQFAGVGDNHHRLIRDGNITPEMGSSLINDARYVDDIYDSLLAMATTLSSHRKRQHNAVERELSLDDAEFDEILSAAEQARRVP